MLDQSILRVWLRLVRTEILVQVKYCTALSILALVASGMLSDATFCVETVISRCNPPKSCQQRITQTLFSDIIDDQNDVST